MRKINCIDVVESVVEEAHNRFSSLFIIDKQAYNILRQYCGAIDLITDEFNGVGYDVRIDETTKNIHIAIICEDVVVYNKGHLFCRLVEKADKVSISINTDEDLCIAVEFVFPSIWVKK